MILRALVLLVALLCTALPAAAGERASAGSMPPERPARGLVYDGLHTAAAGGICDAEGFEIRHGGRTLGCTHGPDAAPTGVDVTERPTTAELTDAATAGAASTGAVPCLGDGTSGFRVQAIYAHPQGTASRYATVAPSIRGWAATNVDEIFDRSAQETAGTRHVRFVTESAGLGCQVDVDAVQLSAAGDDDFGATISELEALGYDEPDRKYLVWMDSTVYCGIGEMYFDDRATANNWNNGNATTGMFARVDSGCWGSTGVPAEAHELMHTLGGVQDSAPHSTSRFGGKAGGHCTDEYDVMCYDDDGSGPSSPTIVCPSTAGNRRFDCRHDDYFHTSPAPGSYLATHWNTANSRFLDGVVPATAPPNDPFAGAEALEGGTDSASGTNVGATKETGEPEHAGNRGGASVWYRWDAPSNGTATITTEGSTFDTLLGVYTGSAVGGLSQVAANDDAAGSVLTSAVTFPATAGRTYRIAVDGWDGTIGPVTVNVALQSSAPTTTPPTTTPTSSTSSSPTVSLRSAKKRVRPGARVVLTATMSKCSMGEPVELRAKSRTWSKAASGSCVASFRVRLRRTTTFQAFARQVGSNAVRVRVRG